MTRYSWKSLFEKLSREYLFITLYYAVVQSLASENAARLAAMQAAEKNIDEKKEEVRTMFNQKRQSSITEELLDIVGGFEALRKHD
jgi:F-type H+-transporting ATPase subunit gamma